MKDRISNIHHAMKQRCYYSKHEWYSRYGGRGITVCEEWQSVKGFRKWALANGYRDDLTLDRINNDGNYEPSNCRWVAPRQQAANRSTKSNTGIVGVYYVKKNGVYAARIRIDGKLIHLGESKSLDEAISMRKHAEKLLES